MAFKCEDPSPDEQPAGLIKQSNNEKKKRPKGRVGRALKIRSPQYPFEECTYVPLPDTPKELTRDLEEQFHEMISSLYRRGYKGPYLNSVPPRPIEQMLLLKEAFARKRTFEKSRFDPEPYVSMGFYYTDVDPKNLHKGNCPILLGSEDASDQPEIEVHPRVTGANNTDEQKLSDAQKDRDFSLMLDGGLTRNQIAGVLRSSNDSISEEAKELMKCRVCHDRKASILFMPCDHLVCCNPCSDTPVCPACNRAIRAAAPARVAMDTYREV